MWVPLTEPRSSIVGGPSPSEMIACRRDTSSSVRWTAAVGSRPMTDCAVRENERTLSGPATTKSPTSRLALAPVHPRTQSLAGSLGLVLLLPPAHALKILLAGAVPRDPFL